VGLLSPLLRHARSRARIVVGSVVAAVVVASALGHLPAREAASVASMLSVGSSGAVATGDYVWGPSRGVFFDLVSGRPVVFLSAPGEGEPRDAWTSRVSVTPGGRPLFARDFHRLTDTSFGDEADIAAAAAGFAFRTTFQGKPQSMSLAKWGEPLASRVSFREPPSSLEYRWGGEVLVLDVGGVAASVSLNHEVMVEPGASLEVVDGQPARPTTKAAPLTIQASDVGAPEAYPSAPFAPLIESSFSGGAPILAEATRGASRSIEIDARQVDLRVLPGTAFPRSETGRVASRAPWGGLDAERVVLVAPLASGPSGSGFLDAGTPFGPLESATPALAVSRDHVALGSWPFDPWDRHGFESVAELAGATGADTLAICATKSGNLVVGRGAGETPPMPGDCVTTITGPGEARPLFVGKGALAEWKGAGQSSGTVLVAFRRDWESATRDLGVRLGWKPSADVKSDPPWLPAAWTAEADRLGATVSLTLIDPQRFRWVLVAGQAERAHRFGGTFREQPVESDRPLSRVAFGLANGKRRGTLGLRIDGSTGLAFRGHDAVLELAATGLTLTSPTERAGVEPTGDATELGLAVDDGALLRAARDRGPRQLRADICVLDERRLVVAESVFDSHEANATLLLELGCQRVVALDRGTEHPAWHATGAAAAGPFDTTALVGIEVPLPVSVTSLASDAASVPP